MKHILFIVTAFAAAFATACSSDKEEIGGGSDDLGDVQFVIEASADVEAQTRAQVQLPASLIPNSNKFSLHITGTYNDDMGKPQPYDQSWESIGKFDSPKMRRGNYKASISVGDMQAEGTKAACFSGEKSFTILARKTISATITASLTNSAVKVVFDEWFNNYYSEAHVKIRTESGNTFDFTTATTAIVFVKPGTKLFMSGTAVKSQTGVKVEFPEAQIGTSAVRTLHTVNLKASEAGGGKLIIDLDDTFTEIEEQVIELNPDAK